MLPFSDETASIDEPNDSRLHFRTKARIKQAIQRAAALSGVDDTAFTINAAYKAAMETINAHERTRLQPVDHAAFFAALDNPPQPTQKLTEAVERHRNRVISR